MPSSVIHAGPAQRTITAIDAAIVAAPNAPRKHLGASVIGNECAREIWYKFRWAVKGQFDARMLRLFNRGHREEPALVSLLRGAGVIVHQAGEFGAANEVFRVTGHDGHFGGTPDAILENVPDCPDTPGLGEFKTFNDAQFKKIVEDGLIKSKWHYFVQMQVYMEYHALQWGLFLGVNKNDDTLYGELVKLDHAIAQKYIARAGEIIYATEPPTRISESPGFWKCRYCDFRDVCHNEQAPEINCRTCAYSAVGPTASWLCARGRVEIAGQQGCPEHNYDPRFFDRWEVVSADFDRNYIELRLATKVVKLGPAYMTSAEFRADCDIPF